MRTTGRTIPKPSGCALRRPFRVHPQDTFSDATEGSSYGSWGAVEEGSRLRWASSRDERDRPSTSVSWPTMGDAHKTACAPRPARTLDQAATRAPTALPTARIDTRDQSWNQADLNGGRTQAFPLIRSMTSSKSASVYLHVAASGQSAVDRFVDGMPIRRSTGFNPASASSHDVSRSMTQVFAPGRSPLNPCSVG
jgi:hypothetical protein